MLEDEGIEGLDVPSSEFVTADDLISQSSLAAIWQRIQGASTGGTPTGLHGNQIASVKALPSGQLLSTTTETTIKVTDELAFEVGVTDSGESQEVRVKVTLTIPKQPDPIVKTATIAIIDPGETKTVTFKVGALVPFGEQTTVKVDVDPVPARRTRPTTRPSTPSSSRCDRVARGRDSSLCGGGSSRSSSPSSSGGGRRGSRRRSRSCSDRARAISSSSRSRCRAGSTTCYRAVDEVAAGLSRVDRRVDGAVTNTAVVRYDAYEGTGGQQSASVALLDATRTGTVVTAIQGRDYARIYVKDLDRGRSSVALSPEEQEAVDRAMAR